MINSALKYSSFFHAFYVENVKFYKLVFVLLDLKYAEAAFSKMF